MTTFERIKELAKKQKMYAYNFIGKRYDVGDKLGFLEATVEFALRREDLGNQFYEYLKTVTQDREFIEKY